MTGLWSFCLLLSFLVFFQSVHCITDSVNSLEEEGFRPPSRVSQQNQIDGPGYSNEDVDSLRSILTMASKRGGHQTFFPVRGKKMTGFSGFHSARGRRSLADLSRMLYNDEDSPILQRLSQEMRRLSEADGRGNKRVDSFSFAGVRGKRPSELENGPWKGTAKRRQSYLLPSDLTGSSQEGISLKRQPPPGFYGLRG